ncbi:MAG: LysR substrate-binding domain-containing protein [Acetobacter sp.]|uniref:LysR substrate-binding domain-containing protein n=1 Tax=Acetobacter sp. TaxID=440 RepID=UPI0039E765BE
MVSRLSLPPFGMLKAFEAFGRTGSIREAAEVLGVSQTIVRRHLHGLEEWMGTALINREAGELTLRGHVFHGRVTQSLREIARATQDARALPEAGLRIRCLPGFACNWLIYRLEEFRRIHPRIEIEILPDRHPSDFERDEVSADIRFLLARDRTAFPATLEAVEICRPYFFPVACPKLAGTINGRIHSVTDLLHERLISTDSNQGWLSWLEGQAAHDVALKPCISMGHISLALAAVKGGQGVAIVDNYVGSMDLAAGNIQRIEIAGKPWRDVSRGVYALVAPQANWHNQALVRFGKWLRKTALSFQPGQ